MRCRSVQSPILYSCRASHAELQQTSWASERRIALEGYIIGPRFASEATFTKGKQAAEMITPILYELS